MRRPSEKSANPLISKERMWEIVLFHEMGHAFGVPHDPSRQWYEGHCTNSWCVLYPKVDHRAVLSVLKNGYPMDFCQDCSTEILDVKNQGKAKK